MLPIFTHKKNKCDQMNLHVKWAKEFIGLMRLHQNLSNRNESNYIRIRKFCMCGIEKIFFA
jgi:hypothetical protein